VTSRLVTLQRHYEQAVVVVERRSTICNVAVYLLGGIGSGLAIVNSTQIFVAVSNALSAALVTLMEKENFNEKFFVYNRSIASLTSVLTWWRSLSPIEKANPQKFTKLVTEVENVKFLEIQSLAPRVFSDEDGNAKLGNELNLPQFKQDLLDNINSRGNIDFKRTWTERHEGFFLEYKGWMASQAMWEKVPPSEIKPKPPVAEEIATKFLESSIISVDPIRRGWECVNKWLDFHVAKGGNLQEWFDRGPTAPPAIGVEDD